MKPPAETITDLLDQFAARCDAVAALRGWTRQQLSKRLFGRTDYVDGLAGRSISITTRRLEEAFGQLDDLEKAPREPIAANARLLRRTKRTTGA